MQKLNMVGNEIDKLCKQLSLRCSAKRNVPQQRSEHLSAVEELNMWLHQCTLSTNSAQLSSLFVRAFIMVCITHFIITCVLAFMSHWTSKFLVIFTFQCDWEGTILIYSCLVLHIFSAWRTLLYVCLYKVINLVFMINCILCVLRLKVKYSYIVSDKIDDGKKKCFTLWNHVTTRRVQCLISFIPLLKTYSELWPHSKKGLDFNQSAWILATEFQKRI